jgi:hypothetical protein
MQAHELATFLRMFVRHPGLRTDEWRALVGDLYEVWLRHRAGAPKVSGENVQRRIVVTAIRRAFRRWMDREGADAAARARFPAGAKGLALMGQLFATCAEETRDHAFDREPRADAVKLASEVFRASGSGPRRGGFAWLAALVIVECGALGHPPPGEAIDRSALRREVQAIKNAKNASRVPLLADE